MTFRIDRVVQKALGVGLEFYRFTHKGKQDFALEDQFHCVIFLVKIRRVYMIMYLSCDAGKKRRHVTLIGVLACQCFGSLCHENGAGGHGCDFFRIIF